MGQENRQSPRIVTEEIVQVHVAPDSTPNSSTKVLSPALFLKAKNISPEGICLETKDFYLPNQLFTLDFEFPHNGSAHAYATVVWSEKNACGLRFLKPEDPMVRLLEKGG